jgi:O-antigen/teichoic acid export membrane protein
VKTPSPAPTRAGLIGPASQTLVTRVVVLGLFLVTNVILARSLGPEGRGTYAVAVLIPTVVSLLAQLGVGPANVYYVSKRLIDRDEIVAHSLSLALVLGAASFLIMYGLVQAVGRGRFLGIDPTYVVIACSAVPFLLLTGFMLGILQGDQRFRLFNSVVLVNYVSLLLALLIALNVFSQRRVVGAVAAWTISSDVTALIAALFVSPIARWSLRMSPDTLKSLLRFGLLSYFGSLTSAVNYRFDVLLVNLFAGARQVGLYAVGTGLAEIVWYLPNAAHIVLAPRVAIADQEQADRLTEAVNRVITLLVLAAAGLLAVTAPVLVYLFFGAEFAQSTWAVWLLLPGTVTFSTAKVLSTYLLGRNHLKIDLLAGLAALLVTISLDLLLIPRYGFVGAAIASSIAYTCAMGVNLTWVVRNSSISIGALLVPRPGDLRMLLVRMRETGLAAVLGITDQQPPARDPNGP